MRARPSRPSTRTTLPIARIPKEGLASDNPYAGVDDQLAREWERATMISGGGKRGSIESLLQSLGSLGEPSDAEFTPGTSLTGRFTNPSRAATAQEALASASSFSDVPSGESKYYLPFYQKELGGKPRAIKNILQSIGLDPNIGNPYTDYLARTGEKMVDQAVFSRGLKGEPADERTIGSDILKALSEGRSSILTAQNLRAELSALAGREDKTPIQDAALRAIQDNPDLVFGLVEESLVSPDLREGYRKSRVRDYERFLNQAPNMSKQGLMDFITGGLR